MSKLTVALFKRGKFEVNLPQGVAETLYSNFVKKCIEVDAECRSLAPEIYKVPSKNLELDDTPVHNEETETSDSEDWKEITEEKEVFTFNNPIEEEPIAEIEEPIKKDDPSPKSNFPVSEAEKGVLYNEYGFKGFLKVKCNSCGHKSSFNATERKTFFTCSSCGEENSITHMRKLYLNCPCCGKSFRYLTNYDEEDVTEACLNCGAQLIYSCSRRKVHT